MVMAKDPVWAGFPGTSFQNITERNMSIEDVFRKVGKFMSQKPQAEYRLIIGTDCQAYARATTFVTGIVIQRVGNGAWACYRKLSVPRTFRSVGQKLSFETLLSEQVAELVGQRYKTGLEDIVLPYVYQGASFRLYVDIDAGFDAEVNKTAPFVSEMVQRVEALGFTARVKPDAVIASGYANRYTKHTRRPKAAY